LQKKVKQAEEAIYANQKDPLVNWDVADLVDLFEEIGLSVTWSLDQHTRPALISAAMLTRWFTPADADASKDSFGQKRPSYSQHLLVFLSEDELAQVETLFRQKLLNETVNWTSKTLFLCANAA